MSSAGKRLARLEAPHASFSTVRGRGSDVKPSDIAHALGGALIQDPSIRLGVRLFSLMHWPSPRTREHVESAHRHLYVMLEKKLKAGAFPKPSRSLSKHLKAHPDFWETVVTRVMIEAFEPNPCSRCRADGQVWVHEDKDGSRLVKPRLEMCPICFGHGQAPRTVSRRARELRMRRHTFNTEVQAVYNWLLGMIRTLASTAATKINAQFE